MADISSEDIDNVEVAHEHSDVNVRAIIAVAAGLVVTAVVVHLAMLILFQHFEAREARRAHREFPLASIETQLPRPPRIQPRPAEDLKELRRQEDEILASYGWVDERAGIARIPIDRAMQLVVERGLPTRPMEGSRK